MPINIYIIEAHPFMQCAISKVLRYVSGIHVCGIAATAEEVLGRLPKLKANLALSDMSLPSMNGIKLVSKLQIQHPEVLCLILSAYQEKIYVQQALLAGARGYIVKGKLQELAGAIQQVFNGQLYLSPQVRNYGAIFYNGLTRQSLVSRTYARWKKTFTLLG